LWQQLRRGWQLGQQSAIVRAKQLTKATQVQAQRAYTWAKPVAQRHRWSLLSLGLLSTASLTAVGAMIWLSRVPPAPECDKINVLSSDAERLYCAQQAAQSGDRDALLAAIHLVESWSPDHPLYPQAKSVLGQWSEMLLLDARDRLANNDLDGAIQLAQRIPKTSPLFEQVQQEINFWQSERNRGQKIFEQLQIALRQQRWNDASGLLAKLALVDDVSWQNRLPNLRKQLDDEKVAGRLLLQARNFASQNGLDQRGDAMRILLSMNRQTFVWEVAQQQIQKWRDQLLQAAAAAFQKNDQDKASRLIATLPPTIEMTSDQRDLVRIVRVAVVSDETKDPPPLLNQLWGLMLADSTVEQIGTASPYYKQAQQLRPRIAQQAEDTGQIELARALASFGQLPALDLAMRQVEQVELKRPQRIQAQTLLARWRKESQVLADRPVLQQARLWAQAGGLDQLRAAVQLVEQIPAGRSSYAVAQRQKAAWVSQIQTIEDQPILDEARAVAQSGNLNQAIQIARRVQPGRALYGEAQDDIWGWSDQLQAIADRNLLSKANEFAAQGALTRAIDVASQITSGSVAGEAQRSIEGWKSERDEILRSRMPESSESQQLPADNPTPADDSQSPSTPAPPPPPPLMVDPPGSLEPIDPGATDPLPPRVDPVPPQ
jgi:hypothetical protein